MRCGDLLKGLSGLEGLNATVPEPLNKVMCGMNRCQRVSAELSGFIERMLADVPEKWGEAPMRAKVLEQAAVGAGMAADLPLNGPVEHSAPTIPVLSPFNTAPPWRGLALIVPAGVVLLAYLLVALSSRYIPDGALMPMADACQEDAGRVGLADAAVETVLIARLDDVERRNSWQSVALDMPKGPLKGQKRAPCRPKGEVEISRACWVQVGTPPSCGNDWYEWKGFCYVPVLAPERPNTSDEP